MESGDSLLTSGPWVEVDGPTGLAGQPGLEDIAYGYALYPFHRQRSFRTGRCRIPGPRHTPTPAAKRCMITELPDEILVQIVRHVVPTGDAYHVFPTTQKWHNRGLSPMGTGLHKFQKLPSNDPSARDRELGTRAGRGGLASTCRRLQNLYYSVFYGENQFLFELKMSASIGAVIGMTEEDLRSFAKYCSVRSTSIWPLSTQILPYVRDLTFCIGIHEDADYHEIACQKAHIEHFLDSLGATNNLNRLAVDVEVQRAPRAKDTNTPYWEDERPRLGWNVRDRQDFALRPIVRRCKDVSKLELVEELWQPLRRIEGLKEVELTGAIRPEVVRYLTALTTGET